MAFEDKIDSEAQIPAEFYHQMRLRNITVYLEAKVPSKVHRSGEFRPDMLVGSPPFCAIEFKRSGKSGPRGGTRQHMAYEGMCLPWRSCCGMEQIDATLDFVFSHKSRDDALAELVQQAQELGMGY